MSSRPPPDDDERTVLRPTIAVDSQMGAFVSSSSFLGHTLPEGTVIGGLEITGLIGEGGFGIVYLAYDSGLQRQVARGRPQIGRQAEGFAELPRIGVALHAAQMIHHHDERQLGPLALHLLHQRRQRQLRKLREQCARAGERQVARLQQDSRLDLT